MYKDEITIRMYQDVKQWWWWWWWLL